MIRTYSDNNAQNTQEIFYILTDHLNTPRKLTDSNGVVVWGWNSDAFGVTSDNTDVDGDGTKVWFRPRFPGQYYDFETGEHYNYFRDYEPGTGRYLQSDPIGQEGGWNTFVYTLANPVNYFDTSGGQTKAMLSSCVIGGPYNPACDAAIIINGCKYIGLGIAAAWGYLSFLDDVDDCDGGCLNEKEKRRKGCQALKDSILKTCRGLKGRKMFSCC